MSLDAALSTHAREADDDEGRTEEGAGAEGGDHMRTAVAGAAARAARAACARGLAVSAALADDALECELRGSLTMTCHIRVSSLKNSE